MRFLHATAVGFVVALGIAGAASCREPTEITVHVFTNLGCPGASGDTLASTSIDAASNTTRTQQCSNSTPYNEVGTLVIVPGASGGGARVTVSVAGAASLNGNPAPDSDACLTQASNANGCLVTTRTISFISHRALDLPILIDSRCANVTCPAGATCIAGQCQSQCVDCDDGGTDAPPDVGGDSGPPLDVIGLAANGNGTCAVLGPAGDVVCWGSNDGGRFGQPQTNATSLPAPVPGVTNVKKLALGGDFACALDNAGKVQCWGSNAMGQLGDGTTTSRLTPASINVIGSNKGFVDVAAGAHHACAVTAGGVAYCWGDNSWYQIDGGATKDASVSTPVLLGATNTYHFAAISAGSAHTCAVVDDLINTSIAHAVLCWGASEGALGDSPGSYTAPTLINVNNAPIIAADVACGEDFTTVSVGLNDTNYGWGRNLVAQVDPQQPGTSPLAPANYMGTSYFYWAKSGGDLACGIDGLKSELYCWGDSTYGQIGSTGGCQFDDANALMDNNLYFYTVDEPGW